MLSEREVENLYSLIEAYKTKIEKLEQIIKVQEEQKKLQAQVIDVLKTTRIVNCYSPDELT